MRALSRAGYSTRGRRSLGLASSLAQCVAQTQRKQHRGEGGERETGQLRSPLLQEPGSIFSSQGVVDQRGQGKSTQVINALSVSLPMFCRSGASQEESKAGGEYYDLQRFCVHMLAVQNERSFIETTNDKDTALAVVFCSSAHLHILSCCHRVSSFSVCCFDFSCLPHFAFVAVIPLRMVIYLCCIPSVFLFASVHSCHIAIL